ncbi:MAG: hypothetical protein Q9213_002466 [Squamulea squamosa]
MEAIAIMKPQIALSITSPNTLSLDLWKGFSGSISINVLSTRKASNDEPPPFVEYIIPCLDWYAVPPVWALARGPLAIKDQSGQNIDIKNWALFNFENSVPDAIQYLRGELVNHYILDRMCGRLLKILRSKLKPGRSYFLGFRDCTFPMQAVRINPAGRRLRPGTDDHWVDVPCHGSEIPFGVVAGTPIPRFQAALSTREVSRGNGGCTEHPVRWIRLKITSLDQKSVIVKMLDPDPEKNHHDISKWVHVYDPSQPATHDILFAYNGGRHTWQKDEGDILESCPGVLTFNQGTSWTLCLEPPDTSIHGTIRAGELHMRILADCPGFSAWKYTDEEHDGHDETPIGWPSNGVIELEPVLDGWDEIEFMLEQEQPMPLFRLPIELRQMIYGYLKFGEGVDVVKFPWNDNFYARVF